MRTLVQPRSPVFLTALLTALTLLAVPGFAASHSEMAPTFHSDVIANLNDAGEKMIALAEATPADMFGWRPNKDVRTVSETYMHVVGTNMLLPPALGAAPPEGIEMGPNVFGMMAEWEKTVTSKEDVIAKLKESFAYAAKAIATIEDLDTKVQLFGTPQSKRGFILIIVTHAHEHLGQSIAYARSFGTAPPWSRPMPAADNGEAHGEDHGHDHENGDGHEGHGHG